MSCSLVSDEELIAEWTELEADRRRLAAREYTVIAEVETRGLATAHGCKTTADFVRQLLRISPAEARGRVRDAERLTRRVAISGASAGPVYPLVAEAQLAGEISPQHARVVYETIEKLPDEVAAEHEDEVEGFLVEQARVFDPTMLARVAERLRATLDQDGSYRDLDRQARRRGLEFHRRPDGTARIEGELTAECAEHLETHLDALARPAPADEGERDPRTPSQRRHDALLAMLKLVERAALLPRTAGVTATILLTMDADVFGTGEGFATTGHGYGVPVDVAKRWAGPEARAILVLLSNTGRVEGYSSTHRIFTEQQRLAMLARDQGCSFPGCDSTVLWTEAHHVTEFQDGGPTSVDNGTLVCGCDHRGFEAMGWRSRIIDGVPWWVPPDWIDPGQRPVQNAMHNQARMMSSSCR